MKCWFFKKKVWSWEDSTKSCKKNKKQNEKTKKQKQKLSTLQFGLDEVWILTAQLKHLFFCFFLL